MKRLNKILNNTNINVFLAMTVLCAMMVKMGDL